MLKVPVSMNIGPMRGYGAVGLRAFFMGVLALVLAGCTMDVSNFFGSRGETDVDRQLASMSQDGVKVGLLLPLSAQGNTANVARALQQAAELAMFDSGDPGIVLVTKDTRGSSDGAAAAARAVIDEGAELIIGPLLASSVTAVSPIARDANVPVIAFSSASSVADRGIYLMSFLPEQEVHSVINHTIGEGRRSIAALIPEDRYGQTVESAFGRAMQQSGGRIVSTLRYPRDARGLEGPAREMAAVIARGETDALLIAEGGDLLRQISAVMTDAGVRPGSIQTLGTGLWDDRATRRIPMAVGGWYAGIDPEMAARFEQRFQSTYGSSPPRLASLAYDAASLAIALARTGDDERFSRALITSRQGFQGVNGVFRFRDDGVIERGLAIIQVTEGQPRVIVPPPDRIDSVAGF